MTKSILNLLFLCLSTNLIRQQTRTVTPALSHFLTFSLYLSRTRTHTLNLPLKLPPLSFFLSQELYAVSCKDIGHHKPPQLPIASSNKQWLSPFTIPLNSYSSIHLHKLVRSVTLSISPSVCPVSVNFCIRSFLKLCPRNVNCLFRLLSVRSSLLTCAV